MLIASDTQLPWGSDPGCTGDPDDCTLAYARLTNGWLAQAMNDIETLGTWPIAVPNSGGQTVGSPEGVIVNGDLTAFFHPWQRQLYREFYDPAHTTPDVNVLQRPIFPGLGNHDYANNGADCWGNDPADWALPGANSCAVQAVRYVRGMVACQTVSNFSATRVHSFDDGSLG
jgi:hypothetical protein